MDSTANLRVAICGAGIIGCSTAYYLAKLGVQPVIIEREEPACAASGKAGGFLALDWNDGSAVGPLSRASYALHRELSEDLRREVGVDVGYREVDTLQVAAKAKASKAKSVRSSVGSVPDWLDGAITGSASIGTPSTTSQVHPHRLTHALLEAAQKLGATLRRGTVQGIVTSEDNSVVTGVRVDGEEVCVDAVVIAMGPWSGVAAEWLQVPLPDISGQKAHSVVLRPAQPITPHCLFTSFTTAQGQHKEPEIYPRPDGTVYVCGESDSTPVPSSPSEVTVREGASSTLQSIASAFSSCLAEAEVEASQACYLPLSPDGAPVIGAIPQVKGAYIATGHSCWGILNGPATGLAMAELITRGSSSINISAFSPARFSSQRTRTKR